MPDLYKATPHSLIIYADRAPDRTGRRASAMTTAMVVLSAVLIFIGIAPFVLWLSNESVRGLFARFGVPGWFFLFFALCGVWNLTGEFRGIIFDSRGGKVFRRGHFLSRPLADFPEASSLDVRETQDEDGSPAHECVLTFRDASRKAEKIVPTLYDAGAVALFRDEIAPRVNAMLASDRS